jgi:tRNA threonylcarbamoyladenosine biosynthesis protein TsaB
MRILAIETATGRQSVAVLEDEQVLARADHEAHGAHAKLLVPTIDRLLASQQLSLKQLDGLVVSIGPGSFTGLRVGLATMLGFRLVTGLPLVGVPTLEGLAWNVPRTALPVCPILKARTGELYWALYRWSFKGDPTLECLSQPRVDSPAGLAAALPLSVTVLGEGWLAYRGEIQQHMALLTTQPGHERARNLLQEASAEAMWPSAVSLGHAGYARFARGDVVGLTVGPLYVQRAEAEVLWETHQRNSEKAGVQGR